MVSFQKLIIKIDSMSCINLTIREINGEPIVQIQKDEAVKSSLST